MLHLNTLFAAGTISIACLHPAKATLEVYEPFDYPATSADDAVFFGDGNQTGAIGLVGAWSTEFSTNAMQVRDEAMTFTDGGGNELPVAGLSIRRNSREGVNVNSIALTPSATAALTGDNTTMWMSFLYEDEGFSGPDSSVMLASGPLALVNSHSLSDAGFGVGILIGESTFVEADSTVETGVYLDSTITTRIQSSVAPNSSENVAFLLAAKINWKPDGTPDEIYVFNITDLTVEPLEDDAIASDTFDMPLTGQQALDTLNIGETQIDAFDEIRFGTTFADVVSSTSSGGSEFSITAYEYFPETNEITLTWMNSGAATYIVRASPNLKDWGRDVEDNISPDEGETTTRTMLLEGGLVSFDELFFRVEEES